MALIGAIIPPVVSGGGGTGSTSGDVLVDRLGLSSSGYDHTGESAFPDQYLRAVVSTPGGSYRSYTSEGLGTWNVDAGDYSSTEAQVAYVGDNALVIDKSGAWSANDGIGLSRLTVENMSNSSLGIFPQAVAMPASYVGEWMQSNHQDETTIGHPIGIARAYGHWTNGGMIVFSNGFVASDGTSTAYCLLRFQMETGKKPTAIALTSSSEFTLITCIDTATGAGQLAVYANYTGKRLQSEGGISSFYHDWPEPHPGLPSIGNFVGAQLLGYVDLGMNFPTGVSAVASRTSDRINAADGNAGTLGDKDLSLQTTRDEFTTGNNTTFISTWGFAVVISKTENKAVYVDMTAMFAGYKTQYTTTQVLYDATLPPSGANYWQEYKDCAWPPRFADKPAWVPTVTATIAVTAPTAVIISEHGAGDLAIGCEDGMVRFWTGGPGAGGTTPTTNGSIQAGRNITCMTYNKYASQNGIRYAGFFAVSRGDRRIDMFSDWGSAATITKTLRDNRMVDPVHCEVYDTHGIECGGFTVCDYNGKQVLQYRYTDATFTNFGGAVYHINAGADWECTGVLAFPGKPIVVSGANVN